MHEATLVGASERVVELRRVPVLSELGVRALEELARVVTIETCEPGERWLARGDRLARVGWVLGGAARWMRAGRTVGTAERGASMGLVELCAGADASASIVATSAMRVAQLTTDRTLELLEESYELADALLGRFAGALAAAGQLSLGARPRAVRSGDASAEIDFVDRLIRLRTSRPFARAPIRALAALAQRSEVRRWPRGARLWRSGRESREVLVVISGAAREGRDRYAPGDTMGLVEALARHRRARAATALAPLSAIRFDVDALTDVLEDDDDFALELLRVCASDLLALRLDRDLPPDLAPDEPSR